ncbi:MAG: carboxymuconolactone decarboxylase family protein [Acidobacteriaceae bacterium]|nr:carboxymuconolactone decarboxylase family protein [Acidobacteriaceae bacterium]
MPERLRYPEFSPEIYSKLQAFGHSIAIASSLEPVLKAFIELRASQMNGCEFCVAAHEADLRKHHEPESRIAALVEFRGSEAFTAREKAALAWTEVLTDLVSGSHASDADYEAVREFFDGKELVDLSFAIANINAWNRLGVAFQPKYKTKAELAAEKGEPPMQDAVGEDGGKVSTD